MNAAMTPHVQGQRKNHTSLSRWMAADNEEKGPQLDATEEDEPQEDDCEEDDAEEDNG